MIIWTPDMALRARKYTWFQASAAIKKITSAPFWDYTQSRVAIPYRRSGKTYRSHLQGSRNPRKYTIVGFSWEACCRDLCLGGTGFELQLRQTLAEFLHLHLSDPYFTKYFKLHSNLMWRYTLAHTTLYISTHDWNSVYKCNEKPIAWL
jgi:hypothetical protein